MLKLLGFGESKICCSSDSDIVEYDTIVLENVSYNDTVPFIAPICSGKVVKVYDGDTITIASKLPYSDSEMYRFSVRLNGIDCPEIRGKTEDEKECAQLAKKELIKLLMGNIVELKNLETEKYGRILADVYIDGLHINNHMLDSRLAVKYDGGTKSVPNSWLDYYKHGNL